MERVDPLLRQPLVYGITIHSFIVGQPFRLRQFRRVMEALARLSERIWFTTAGACAQHCASLFPAPDDHSTQGTQS